MGSQIVGDALNRKNTVLLSRGCMPDIAACILFFSSSSSAISVMSEKSTASEALVSKSGKQNNSLDRQGDG